MKKFTFVLGLYLLGFLANATVPTMPPDPSSTDAFNKIKNYYRIQNGLPEVTVTSATTKFESNYSLQTIKLRVSGYPDVILTLKMPTAFRPPLPALVLFSGFQTGAQAVNLLGDPENLIYVGFQYPWPIDLAGTNLQWDWRRVEMIPVLMSAALSWLFQQPYIDREKINIIAVSFGTLFYPLAQRFLNESNIQPATVVFGYGGVGVDEIIANGLAQKIGKLELEILKGVIREQTWIFEPKYHLFDLHGPFLVVHGQEDNVFPLVSKEELNNLLPQPKKIVTLPGPHIQPEAKEIIANFLKEVETFLKENNAI